MSEIKAYTISIFTENLPGLLHRITTVFTRRKINLESFTASESEMEGIYRFTIVVRLTYEDAFKVVRQLDKLIGVFNAFIHDEGGVVLQEVALYKMPLNTLVNGKLEEMLQLHNARVLAREETYVVLEKTGRHEDTQALLHALKPFGILEFARSGLVSVMKQNYNLEKYIAQEPLGN